MTFFEMHHQCKSDGSEDRTGKWGAGFTLVVVLGLILLFAAWLCLNISKPRPLTVLETHRRRKSDGSEYGTRKWSTDFSFFLVLVLILLIFASWLRLDVSTPLSLLRIFVGLASSI